MSSRTLLAYIARTGTLHEKKKREKKKREIIITGTYVKAQKSLKNESQRHVQ